MRDPAEILHVSAKTGEGVEDVLKAVIDRIADKKVVHKNLASRSKHRLANAIKSMA